MTDTIAEIRSASELEAFHLLAVLEQRRAEPQVASIALMMAAAKLLGRVAVDRRNLRVMNLAMSNIMNSHSGECFAIYNAEMTMTKN